MTETTEALSIGSTVKKPRKRPRYSPFALWLVPILGHIFLFSVFPILASFFLAFTDKNVNHPEFQLVGFSNFIEAFQDHVFIRSIENTLYFSFVSVPVGMAISLIVAQLIFNRKYCKSIWRSIYFLPGITPLIASIIIWRYFLQPSEYGVLNNLIAIFGIPAQEWLKSTTEVIPSIIIMTIWGGLGLTWYCSWLGWAVFQPRIMKPPGLTAPIAGNCSGTSPGHCWLL